MKINVEINWNLCVNSFLNPSNHWRTIMGTQTQYTRAKIHQSSSMWTKKDSNANNPSDWFMNKKHPMDTLLPQYNPFYEELDLLYTIQDHPTIHAIANYLITKISFSSYVWSENFILEPFEKANRYFFSGYGNMQVIKPEVQQEIIKIITNVLPVRYIPRQTAWRGLIGLKYKERLEW